MAVWKVRRDGARVAAQGTDGWNLGGQASVTLAPRAAGGLVALNGRWYRGRLSVMRDRTGLTVINTVPLEEYLVGVVAAEMGRKDSTDIEALAAQAIVSRTFAIRNLGKRAADGFDLLPTVVDQAYTGFVGEYALARAAVARTAGMVVTWQGVPIDAFFFSTCAGRTANGTEVFAAADRPYLVSIRDVDGDGQPYCRLSPRYRWREDWTAGQLESVLRQTLPVETGTPAEQVSGLRAVQVVRRSAVRRALHPVGETALRSATFELLETRDGDRLTGLTAIGAGAGHGVGFCQWGAVGRARAGQDALTILGAYFPGTTVSRAY
jgi:stage II sporulation protein D